VAGVAILNYYLSTLTVTLRGAGAAVKRQQYLLKKISWAVFTIAVVLVLNFFLFRILPATRPVPASMTRA
jgi:hypothetical protein